MPARAPLIPKEMKAIVWFRLNAIIRILLPHPQETIDGNVVECYSVQKTTGA
jgi:hypothetical protein